MFLLHLLIHDANASFSWYPRIESDSYNHSIKLANDLFRASNYDSAIYYYNKARFSYEDKNDKDSLYYCLVQLSKSNIALSNFDAALHFANQAKYLLNEHSANNNLRLAENDYLVGTIHNKVGEVNLAEISFINAKEKCSLIHYDSLEALVGKALGNINLSKGNYNNALVFYQDALELENSRNASSNQLRASLIQNIGIIYSLTGEYILAGEFFQKSMLLKEEYLADDDPHLANVYINYGRFQTVMGNQTEALFYLDKAEKLFYTTFGPDYPGLASIFFNKGSIYIIQSNYDKALDYHEKAIELYSKIRRQDDNIFGSLFNNIGIIYENFGEFDKAIEYYKKSLDFDLQPNTYVRALSNLASCYHSMKDYNNSELTYKYAIAEAEKYFGRNSFISSNLYLNYGNLCDEIDKHDEAHKYIYKSFSINSQIKGLSDSFLANNLTQLGIHHSNHGEYLIALEYFQLALISAVESFHEGDVYQNPSKEDLFVDLNLFNALYSKLKTFFQYYLDQTKNQQDLLTAYETAVLSVELNDMIKSSFAAENSKLIFTSRTNELYNLAVLIAVELYELTGNMEYFEKSFELSERSKGAVLLSSIRESEAIDIGIIPEDIRLEETTLKNTITTYKKLILDEIQKENPDSIKLVLWKNEVFARSLRYDSLVASIEIDYPDYYNLKYSNETARIGDIQNELENSELLVEYKIIDTILITFCVSRDTVFLVKSKLGEDFLSTVESYIGFINSFPTVSNSLNVFKAFVSNSNELFSILIEPIYNIESYSKIIVIPDDYLLYMTFEALVQEKDLGDKANYRGLNYLIKDYVVSYANSATILMHKVSKRKKNGRLLAMAPDYDNIEERLENPAISLRNLSQYLNPLDFTLKEVRSISSVFNGRLLIEEEATEKNFKEVASNYGILHFAMHTIIDDENPLTSKLVFSLNNDSIEDGFLNTYEIYNLDLNAELAVLSACKTGIGKMSKGEGIMSLARGFLYAGVPGIVMTLWEVEDISSATIMEDFYKFLKKGYRKDRALRDAKLKYLESADQLNSHPYFWAAYVQIGDNSTVGRRNNYHLYLIIAIILSLVGFGIYRFKLRKKS